MQLKKMPSSSIILEGSSASSPERDLFLSSNNKEGPLRLHISDDIKRVDLQQLAALSAVDPATDIDLAIARNYLENPSIYASVVPDRTSRDCAIARGINETDSQKLLDAGVIELVPDSSSVKGRVICFTVDELEKGRKRFINHAVDSNNFVPAAPGVTFRSIPDRLQMVHRGAFFGCIDFKSYYHQLPLSAAVRDFFCFYVPTPQGTRLVRLKVAATGDSHVVYVAVACTNKLLSFAKQSNDVDSHIDNIAFVGDSVADVAADIRAVAERCQATGVTINEDVAKPELLVTTKSDWVGIHLDFTNKTACITKKTHSKVVLSWSLRSGWTNRGFAAHFGLLNYASLILDVPIADYFNLLRFASNLARKMHESDHTQWDEPITIWPSAMADLARWTDLVVANTPRLIKKRIAPNLLIAVDSSKLGFGYTALDEVTGRLWTYGEKWSPEFVRRYGAKLQSSIFTEPRGTILAKAHALSCVTGPRALLVAGDNVASAATLRRRFCYRSFDLNEAAKEDRRLFPDTQTDYISIPGAENWVADHRSRHFNSDTNKIVVLHDPDNNATGETTFTPNCLRRLLGVIPGGLQSPGAGTAA